jgi:hypothetical protein
MLSFFKFIAVIGVMFLIIPLAVWGGSGNWRHALYALKSYCLIMAGITVAGMLFAATFWLASLGAS